MTAIKLGRRHFTVGAAAGAASFGFPALAQGEPIKVGVIVPLSGPAGPNGQAVLHAVQVAAEMVNAKGGVMGRKTGRRRLGAMTRALRRSACTRANEMVGEKVALVIEELEQPGDARRCSRCWPAPTSSMIIIRGQLEGRSDPYGHRRIPTPSA